MSSLRPALLKREPLAKSAPDISALTNRTISPPSVEPSPSIATMMSPVEAVKPATSASPLPTPPWSTTFTSGLSCLATSIVLSVDRPSTRTISSTHGGIVAKTAGRFEASFITGTTTLTRGEMARPSATLR